MGQMMPDAKQRAIYVLNVGTIFPKQCLHNGVLTFGVKELAAGRNGARGGGARPSFRRSHCGFERIPLRFDAPAVVSREFRCVSMLPLWFRANSGLFWRVLASSGLFWGGRLGCRPQRRTRWGGAFVSTVPLWFRANSVAFRRCRCGFARIPLRFDAPAVVSREFRPLLACSGLFWPRSSGGANGARGGAGPSFRRSRCGFARIPLHFDASRCGFARIPLHFDAPAVVSREFRPRLGGPLRLQAATAHAVGRGLRFDAPAVVSREFRCVRRSRCGFARIPLRFDAPAVVSREFRPLLAGRLGCGPQRHTRPSFRRSHCGFVRIPLRFPLWIPLRFDAPAVVSRQFRPLLACSGLFWGGPLWFRAALGRGLRFNTFAVVSREFRCVSTLLLWFRARNLSGPPRKGQSRPEEAGIRVKPQQQRRNATVETQRNSHETTAGAAKRRHRATACAVAARNLSGPPEEARRGQNTPEEAGIRAKPQRERRNATEFARNHSGSGETKAPRHRVRRCGPQPKRPPRRGQKRPEHARRGRNSRETTAGASKRNGIRAKPQRER